jgi:hypothetical protein
VKGSCPITAPAMYIALTSTSWLALNLRSSLRPETYALSFSELEFVSGKGMEVRERTEI